MGDFPPAGLFPKTLGEAMAMDTSRLDQLRKFYAHDFGILPSDTLEQQRDKFLAWIGCRPAV